MIRFKLQLNGIKKVCLQSIQCKSKCFRIDGAYPCSYIYDIDSMKWKEEERSGIRDVQMDNLRGLLGVMKMVKIPNAQIKELYAVMKGLMKVFSHDSAM